MKKALYSITVAIYFLSLISCGNKLISTSSKYFEILNATETQWSAGTLDAGRGVDYHIFVSEIAKDTPIFDTAWVDHQKIAVEASFMAKRKNLLEVHIGYTIDNSTSTKEVLPPFNYKGKALIRYKIKGRTKYLLVKEFVLQKPVNFQ